MKLRSINPATLELLAETKELSSKEVDRALAAAHTAFGKWRAVAFPKRAALMRKAADVMRARKRAYAKLISREVGKTARAAEAEIEKCALTCEYYAKHAHAFLADEHIETEARESFVRFDPLGVVLAVMPWNFPFWQVIRFAAPALMAGNTGLLKHASNAQQSARALESIFRAAGFPKGVFQNLAVSSSKVAAIIADPRVAAVTLTGSDKAGSEVAKTAGEHLKKTVLELGGSDPFIVFADSDLAQAAKTALAARLQGNAGQSCIAAKRFIVEKKAVPAFAKLLQDAVSKLVVGDPLDPKTDVGSLANEQVLRTTESQVTRSVKAGARVLTGGKPVGRGYFFAPMVLTHVTPDMPVCSEEVFGPVLPIISFKSEAEAIRIANSSPYGLGASVFTRDKKRAKRMAAHIESGSVFINSQVKSDPRLPFGGVKRSGYGRELSQYGIREFVNIKTVSVR